VDDAGPDVDAAEAGKHLGGGPAVNPNVARLKQCCAALSSQAKALGNSPEAGQLNVAAVTCNQFAAGLAPNANVPELAPFKQLLKSVKAMPPICAGL
jgi:hypothetical protein